MNRVDGYLLFLLITLIVFPAFSQHQSKEEGASNEANRYMHQSNIDRLIDAFESPGRTAWQKPDEVIALFGDIKDKKIMDLGAGSGYFTFRLANQGAIVISADVDDQFQENIKEKLEKEDFRHLKERIEVRKVPYNSPALEKDEVDGILLVNTYHHIDDRVSYMKKAFVGLKPGGKIIIVDFKETSSFGPPRSHKLELNAAVNEQLAIGYSRIIIDMDLLAHQYVIIGEK